MKIVLALFMVCLSISAGVTFAELQEKLLTSMESPFVNLLFIYDSKAPSNLLFMQLLLNWRRGLKLFQREKRDISKFK